MTHINDNFSYKSPPCFDGDVFDHCNLAQAIPHTPICVGKTGLIFRECNLSNCDVPVGSVVENCNVHQVSFCTHLHPEAIADGVTACSDNCEHVVSIDEIVVEGVVIDTVYTREDKIVV